VPAQKVPSFRISTRARARAHASNNLDRQPKPPRNWKLSARINEIRLRSTLHAKQKLIPRERRRVVRIRIATSTACHALLARPHRGRISRSDEAATPPVAAVPSSEMLRCFDIEPRSGFETSRDALSYAPFHPLRVALDRQRETPAPAIHL